jgi:D-glycero-D-manno-heptose 1,7-bisphosphate phosphatase
VSTVSRFPLQPAIFLDRDGVIIENRADYVKSIDEVHFIPGVLAALAGAARLPCRLVIVTNQSVIGRGLIDLETAGRINEYVVQRLAAAGGRMDGTYVCPHRPDFGCDCRKPAPGLLLQAAAELSIDLAASVMIGDALSDVLAGQRAGMRAILVRTGRGQGQLAEMAPAERASVPVVADLAEALQRAAAALVLTKTPPEGGAGVSRTSEILP